MPWNAGRGVLGGEHAQRVVAPGVEHEEDREHQEDADLEHAEDGAQPRRGPDPVEPGGQHDHRAEQRPRPPQVRRVTGDLGVERPGRGEPELEQHQRRDQEPDQHVPPGHQEPDRRVQAAGGVGGQRPRGRHLARQLADAPGAEQARDQREDDGERQGSAAKATPAGIDAAMAAPGAMSVMLWNRTSRRPIALRRNPVLVSVRLRCRQSRLLGRTRSLPGCSHGGPAPDQGLCGADHFVSQP